MPKMTVKSIKSAPKIVFKHFQALSVKTRKTLHVNQKDYIIDYEFARDMQSAIDRYEEKMKHYERDREFPRIFNH